MAMYICRLGLLPVCNCPHHGSSDAPYIEKRLYVMLYVVNSKILCLKGLLQLQYRHLKPSFRY